MNKIIAVTGKGGVGKTTLSGLIIKDLIDNACVPVLAVDADPNTCLDAVLGIQAHKTIGRVREEAGEEAKKGLGSGISKQQYLEMKITESLVEAENFDFIAMGRPEGPGCYCYANNVLRSALGHLAKNYPYVVLDNEAGLENLSRRIVQKVDLLIMIADPSHRGLETIKRLYELALEMKINFSKLALVINRQRSGHVLDGALRIKEVTKADFLINIMEHEEVFNLSETGSSLFNLSNSNPVLEKVHQLLVNGNIIENNQISSKELIL